MSDSKHLGLKLGTDKVREIFGELKPQVIYHDDDKRVMLTKSLDDAVGAYLIVQFDEFGRKLMPKIHKEILQGNFVGETFRKHDVPIFREDECTFVYILPKQLQEIFGSSGRESFVKKVKFRIGHVRVPYASIIEVYSPRISFDFLFEDSSGKAKGTAQDLDREFDNKESYAITSLNPVEIEKYLVLAYEFLRKPIHVGIEDKEEFVHQTLETGLDLIRDPNTILLVAKKEDDFLGYLAANIHPALHINGNECMIRELYVQENSRRKGLASALVRTIERIASERGAKRVSLATNMNDELQNSFYSSLGYTRRCDFDVKYLGDKNAR